MVAFNNHDWEEAKLLFKDVKKKYGYSRYARLAELRIADIDFALREARRSHPRLSQLRARPSHRSRGSLRPFSHLQGALRSGQRLPLFAPPQEERDQATTMEAYKELSSS